jgi:GTP-binding protein HflX
MGTRRDEESGFSTETPRERAVLAGVHLPLAWAAGIGGEADLPELERLAETAGADVVGQVEQRRNRPVPSTFLGKGKLEGLKELVEETEATLVIFDNDLTPAQGRNLEKALDVNILDRTELILDIFASHANTRQARLQVELAQLKYLLPRLTRLWSHLERQAGGIGTRGPGETQLETDRRLVNRRISVLDKALAEIETTRQTQLRSRQGTYTAALIGYTNAGKSTLMNGLTGAGVYVKDQLFATLDATTRKVEIDERRRFLLTDTVGFIRRLPHHLIESFKATLQEVRDADLMVHVVDASSEDPELFINRFGRSYPGSVFVAGRSEEGATDLREAILARLTGNELIRTVRIPITNLHCLSSFHRTGSVLEQEFEADMCLATLRLTEKELNRLLSREGAVLVEES